MSIPSLITKCKISLNFVASSQQQTTCISLVSPGFKRPCFTVGLKTDYLLLVKAWKSAVISDSLVMVKVLGKFYKTVVFPKSNSLIPLETLTMGPIDVAQILISLGAPALAPIMLIFNGKLISLNLFVYNVTLILTSFPGAISPLSLSTV